MAATDKRVGVLDELLTIIRTVKIYAMEDDFRNKVVVARDNELNELNNYIIAFTAIILFKNLLHILNEAPSIIISITQVSISRIEEFLRESEIDSKIVENNSVILDNNNCIGFDNATIQWTNNKGPNKFALINLNIRFLPGKLSIIFGPSGCGKNLGNLTSGDETEIGENGVVLSNGQKQHFCHDAYMTVYIKDGQIEKIEYSHNNLLEHERIEEQSCEYLEFGTSEPQKLITEEIKAEGMVNWGVYATYMIKSKKRIMYLALEGEQKIIVSLGPLLNEWPTMGDIQVKNLEVRYSINDPPVLKNISFHVNPGEKIGIIGSGKSTLARSFIRLNSNNGQIIIDGIDISKVDIYALRRKISIIPQDPLLFKDIPTYKIYDALRKAHLIGNDSSLTPDTIVDVGGNNFSQGQRQQIALARAILNKSKVVIMDELTASIDYDIDRKIQETIREEFKDSTLLYITHRIETIMDYDKILVLDNGKIVEFDNPYTLLQNPDSELRKICVESGKLESLCI
ncbi:3116_t:CDS:10 [Racocetra fulgida]|uniref:3116_t:CDS:1 n=1 Tax=Racocetra fulgida TaxID=60492 RepID=A0A9N8WTJ0_9GLOM|nr:3116_t:CDS:10 [Racocetra fulgida]